VWDGRRENWRDGRFFGELLALYLLLWVRQCADDPMVGLMNLSDHFGKTPAWRYSDGFITDVREET
jgi:hypothetical protein